MTRSVWRDVCLISLVLSAVGCSVREERRQTSDTTRSGALEGERLRFQGSAERRLADWGRRLDSLRTAAGEKQAEATAEMRREIEDLEARREEAARRLGELRAAGAGRWSDAKRHVADMLDSLDRRFDSMRSRLRDERG